MGMIFADHRNWASSTSDYRFEVEQDLRDRMSEMAYETNETFQRFEDQLEARFAGHTDRSNFAVADSEQQLAESLEKMAASLRVTAGNRRHEARQGQWQPATVLPHP